MSKLAINGGPKLRTKPFQDQKSFDQKEIDAVMRVFEGKLLSNYRGNWQPEFWGGNAVQALERKFEKKFNVKHALAVNSCTSALQIACGAIGLEPGDEVIVTPWSMSCSATAPMVYGAIPVFADIERGYFCLDPEDVKRKITSRTKAIIAVDLFGQPFAPEIMDIAREHGLYVIEDAAQAIGSYQNEKVIVNPGTRHESNHYSKKYAGTIGHIGCFSFTQGKHLTSGEGGMITTNDDDLRMKCALIRNHAESVINGGNGCKELEGYEVNMVGFNMRMTEIQAAIVSEQLDKLDDFIYDRIFNTVILNDDLCNIPAIIPVSPRPYHYHSYYVHGFYFDSEEAGVHRDKFIEAVKAELTGEVSRPSRPLLGTGYIKPLYLMPVFQKRQHWMFRKGGHDYYTESEHDRYIHGYDLGRCPAAEILWKHDFFLSLYHGLPLDADDRKDIVDAFTKVWENRGELK